MKKILALKPKRSSRVFWSALFGRIWIFNPELAEIHSLENRLSADIWKLCSGKLTAREIVKRLRGKYLSKEESILKDTLDFLETLEDKDLLFFRRKQPYEKRRKKVRFHDSIELINKLKEDPNSLAVFFRGSRAMGFVTGLSDVDLGVITASKKGEEVLHRGNQEIHITYLPEREIENRLNVADENQLIKTLDLIQNAKTIFQRDRVLSVLKQRIKERDPPTAVVNFHLRSSWSQIVDAFSEIVRGEQKNAVLVARVASFEALTAFLLFNKVYVAKMKWKYPVLRRLGILSRRYVSLFEKINVLDDISRQKSIEMVMRSTEFVQRIEDLIKAE